MKASIIFVAAMTILSACNMKQEKTEQVSTIDSDLQAKVMSIMENKLKEFDAQSGQVIVMDIQTGQVKASYGKNFTTPYRSELVCPATLLAALETGKVHLDDTVDTGDGCALSVMIHCLTIIGAGAVMER